MANPATYPSSNLVAQSIGYDVPTSGALTIPIALDFSINSSWLVDLSASQSTSRTENVQSAYIDNSSNPNNLFIQVVGTNQQIAVPRNSQTWQPLLVGQNPKFIFTTPSTGANQGPFVNVFLSNIPIPNGSSNAQQVVLNQYNSLGMLVPTLIGDNNSNTLSTSTVNSQNGPNFSDNGFGYYLTNITAWVAPNSTLAAAALATLQISAPPFFTYNFDVWVPATTPSVLTPTVRMSTPPGFLQKFPTGYRFSVISGNAFSAGGWTIEFAGGVLTQNEAQPL